MSDKTVTKKVGRKSVWQNGRKFVEGDKIELTKEQAEVIDFTQSKEVVTEKVEVEKQVQTPLTDNQKVRLCVGYWLDVADADKTNAGLPKVAAMQKLTGYEVGAADIQSAADIVAGFAVLFKAPAND